MTAGSEFRDGRIRMIVHADLGPIAKTHSAYPAGCGLAPGRRTTGRFGYATV